jgi:hypothetical protein
MSTHISDFAAAVVVQQAVEPSVQTAGFNGTSVDLVSCDGDCFAVQQVGSFADGTTWSGHFEESADGTSWSSITGAAFDPVTEGFGTQVIRFRRAARFVRYVGSVTGVGPETSLAVLVGEPRKTF